MRLCPILALSAPICVGNAVSPLGSESLCATAIRHPGLLLPCPACGQLQFAREPPAVEAAWKVGSGERSPIVGIAIGHGGGGASRLFLEHNSNTF